ncbi:hypothetical protein [Streptomyces sp. NBC_00859]|uniref:hypothetical protein n=1 Tax=Streptomyces sp. NBC_00859 TaxID=2903682 RepID=UPI00386AAED6|nr:hypothetical protein OG584_20555 [Streptomyces sp. NBC_00859]
MLAFQAMFCAVAGALGARQGIVITDRLAPGSGVTDSYAQQVVTVRAGRPDQVLAALDGRARALGYVREPHDPGRQGPADQVTRDCYRYKRVRNLPYLAIGLASPGELNGFTVPEGSVGFFLHLRTGFTGSEDGSSTSAQPNTATRAHLAQLGVDFARPPGRRRFTWWGARLLTQVRLTWTARRLGVLRGRRVATWLVGGEFTGPCTLGVMTIRRGERQHVVDELRERAGEKGYRYGVDDAATPRTPMLNLAVHGPGEQIDAGGRKVPEGSVAVVVTLTDA